MAKADHNSWPSQVFCKGPDVVVAAVVLAAVVVAAEVFTDNNNYPT
jgi:hypothetical protein